LLGIAAFQEQRYEDAILHWQQILAANPDNPNADALRGGVLRAQQLVAAKDSSAGAEQPLPTETTVDTDKTSATVAAEMSVELQIRVSLPDDLTGRVDPGDTLFILVRPVGERMPLAVTRRSASELPVTVTLNDSMAMGPMAKLSSAEQVEVVARISKSGTPQAQPGDIEGSVGPIVLHQQDDIVPLLLSTVVR
jgi:cytochrome c-type biogenesis protein CcmH